MVSLLSALIPAAPSAGLSPTGKGAGELAPSVDFGALLAIVPEATAASPPGSAPVDPRQPLAAAGIDLPLAIVPAGVEVPSPPADVTPRAKPTISTRALLMAQLAPPRTETVGIRDDRCLPTPPVGDDAGPAAALAAPEPDPTILATQADTPAAPSGSAPDALRPDPASPAAALVVDLPAPSPVVRNGHAERAPIAATASVGSDRLRRPGERWRAPSSAEPAPATPQPGTTARADAPGQPVATASDPQTRAAPVRPADAASPRSPMRPVAPGLDREMAIPSPVAAAPAAPLERPHDAIVTPAADRRSGGRSNAAGIAPSASVPVPVPDPFDAARIPVAQGPRGEAGSTMPVSSGRAGAPTDHGGISATDTPIRVEGDTQPDLPTARSAADGADVLAAFERPAPGRPSSPPVPTDRQSAARIDTTATTIATAPTRVPTRPVLPGVQAAPSEGAAAVTPPASNQAPVSLPPASLSPVRDVAAAVIAIGAPANAIAAATPTTPRQPDASPPSTGPVAPAIAPLGTGGAAAPDTAPGRPDTGELPSRVPNEAPARDRGEPVRAEPAFRAFAAAIFDAANTGAPVASAAPAAPMADAAPIDLTQQRWPHAMVDRIERLRDEASLGDTRIRLIPDALGTIDVALRRDGDTMQVAFRAEQAETRQLLAEARPELTALAEARGIRIADAAVPSPTTAASNGGWANPQPGNGHAPAGHDRAPGRQQQPSTPAAPPRAAVAADAPGDDTRIA